MIRIAALVWLLASPVLVIGQNASSRTSRACPEDWNRSASSQSKAHQSKDPRPSSEKNTSDNAGACIELKASALDVQEFLQAYVRDQKWKLTDEHVSEDSWTFSRELSPDELSRDTKPYRGTQKIEWTKGTVVLNMDTSPMDDGWSRTTIKAIYRGYGQDQDQFATQREYWELESNNALESSLIVKLLPHMKS